MPHDGPYNRVQVRYVDAQGAVRLIARSQTVPELDARGATRCGWIDLGGEAVQRAQAERVGGEFLLLHR